MSNELDTRLHGHGGGVEEPPALRGVVERYLRHHDREARVIDISHCTCAICEDARELLASNSEPEDAEVDECDRDNLSKLALEWLETPNTNRLNVAERIYELGRQSVLASNPSPEPEDAEVETALYRAENHAPQKYVKLLAREVRRLRSQAGQGRVVTADMFREAFNESSVSWERRASRMNAILAVQEPREMSDEVFPIPWSETEA